MPQFVSPVIQGLRLVLAMLVLAACTSQPVTTRPAIPKPDKTPELSEVRAIIEPEQAPPGIVFVTREYDEEALTWLMPRLLYYVSLLRERFPALSIAVLSHGDEILALTTQNRGNYPDTHAAIERLVGELQVNFHICGAYAHDNGLSDQDFPDYIDVVPFGPTQISDYQSLGYELIDLELTW